MPPIPTPSKALTPSDRELDQTEQGKSLEVEQLGAIRATFGDRLAVLAVLGTGTVRSESGGHDSRMAAFLAREIKSGDVVVATVAPKLTGAAGGYDITLWRELEDWLPGPDGFCPGCGDAIRGWTRHCACGTDQSGIPAGTEDIRRQLLEHARQATAGEFQILGSLPYAGGGGFAYFARELEGQRAVFALRIHADGAFEDGTERFSLSASGPLAEVGSGAYVVRGRGRSPHSGPVKFTPVDALSVVTEETAARNAADELANKRDSDPKALDSLASSFFGSGLLAQQPTPSGQQPVPVAKVCPQCGAEYDTASRFCPNDGTPLRPKGTSDPYVGRILADRYHMLKSLGEGGMGRVYLAEHVKMNRQCAVKVMSGTLLSDADAAQRFAREASNAARIIHPNVAAVFDYGEFEGIVYLVMEYVDGEPLSRLLVREPALAPTRALDIAHQVTEALVAAHELGIVHRDLKPDNIIIAKTKTGREIAKVVDFGIAKAVEERPNESLTRTGLVIGTPEYMSPEQLLGDPVDARTDIYSLGCILYQMLTGRRSFDEPTREQMIKRRLTEKAPHPRDLVPELPKTLDLIVARMLARSPQDRYSAAADLRDLLIPAIALEGGFDDPSWRPATRSNPTVYIRAAEQPTQEMTPITPFPGLSGGRPIWRRAALMAGIATGALALGLGATVVATDLLKNEVQPVDTTRNKDMLSKVPPVTDAHIFVPSVTPAPLPRNGGQSAADRRADSARTAARDARPKGDTLPRQLKQPIEDFRNAIESGLMSTIRSVYPAIVDEKEQYALWDGLFNANDLIRAKVEYIGAHQQSKLVAEVRFRITVSYGSKNSRANPTDLTLGYLAYLVRSDPNKEWLIQKLAPIKQPASDNL